MKNILLLFIFAIFSSCVPKQERFVYQQDVMYTVFDIVLYSTNKHKKQLDTCIDVIWKDIKQLEIDLSPAGDGYLGKLNREAFITRSENPEAFAILSNFITISKQINQQSQGAFDLTVYPLIRLWGFYLQDAEKRVPSEVEIQQALKTTGMESIIFTNDGILLKNSVKIDIGAIAKGYTVDRVVNRLKQNTNLTAGFVNAGGNIRVFGSKPDQTPWKVGIRNPNGEAVSEIINLYDEDAIATSGDYEQYFELDGKFYHHIFDPKTGRPVTHNLASVSVVLKGSAELTDILATTFLVLGKKKALEIQELFSPDAEMSLFFIERNGNELISSETTTWTKRKE